MIQSESPGIKFLSHSSHLTSDDAKKKEKCPKKKAKYSEDDLQEDKKSNKLSGKVSSKTSKKVNNKAKKQK
jgi:hypothetical protein